MSITYEDLLAKPNLYIPFQNSVEPTILDTNAAYTVNQGTVTRNNGAFEVSFAEPTFTNDGPFGDNACQLPAGYPKSINLTSYSWSASWTEHEKEYNSLNDYGVSIEFWIKIDSANKPAQDVTLLKDDDLNIVYIPSTDSITVSEGLYYSTYSGNPGGALNPIPVPTDEWHLITIVVKGYGRYGAFETWGQNGIALAYVDGRLHGSTTPVSNYGTSYNNDYSTQLINANFREQIYNESGSANDIYVGPFGYSHATNGLKIAHFALWRGPAITQRSHTRRYVFGRNFGQGVAKVYKDDIMLASNPALRLPISIENVNGNFNTTGWYDMNNNLIVQGGYQDPSNATEFWDKGGLEGGGAYNFYKTTAVPFEGTTNYGSDLPIWLYDNLYAPGNFTIEFWYKDNHDFKTLTAVRPQFIVFTPNASNAVSVAMNLRQSTALNWDCYFRLNDMPTATLVNSNTLQRSELNYVWDKGWHHFAITCARDIDNNTLKFEHWLDGTRMSSNTFAGNMENPSYNPTNNPTYSNAGLNYNGHPQGLQYPTGKVLDGIYLHNRVLPDGEIVSRWYNHNKINTYARTWETFQRGTPGEKWPLYYTLVSHWKHQAEEPKYYNNGQWLPFDNNVDYYDGTQWVDLPQ